MAKQIEVVTNEVDISPIEWAIMEGVTEKVEQAIIDASHACGERGRDIREASLLAVSAALRPIVELIRVSAGMQYDESRLQKIVGRFVGVVINDE